MKKGEDAPHQRDTSSPTFLLLFDQLTCYISEEGRDLALGLVGSESLLVGFGTHRLLGGRAVSLEPKGGVLHTLGELGSGRNLRL